MAPEMYQEGESSPPPPLGYVYMFWAQDGREGAFLGFGLWVAPCWESETRPLSQPADRDTQEPSSFPRNPKVDGIDGDGSEGGP